MPEISTRRPCSASSTASARAWLSALFPPSDPWLSVWPPISINIGGQATRIAASASRTGRAPVAISAEAGVKVILVWAMTAFTSAAHSSGVGSEATGSSAST